MCNQRLSLTRPKTQCKSKLFYNKKRAPRELPTGYSQRSNHPDLGW